jgi:outer membrane lipoprotein carrier protein
VREAGDIDGMNLLELRPIEADSEFDRVLLGLRDDVLQLMAMEDAFGLRTEIRFFEVRRNEPLDTVLFAFTPPPGADVIGDAEGDLDDG